MPPTEELVSVAICSTVNPSSSKRRTLAHPSDRFPFANPGLGMAQGQDRLSRLSIGRYVSIDLCDKRNLGCSSNRRKRFTKF